VAVALREAVRGGGPRPSAERLEARLPGPGEIEGVGEQRVKANGHPAVGPRNRHPVGTTERPLATPTRISPDGVVVPVASLTPVDLHRSWGLAENGAAVEVALVPGLIPELERRWPPLGLERHRTPVGRVEARFGLSDTWMVVPDREPSGERPSPEAWDHLETQLTLFAVTRMTRLVPIHSAAIAWKGSVLVVPAPSEGGKSTLAIAAHEAGATILSDEYTLVDPTTGLVTGWPRSVRRRNPDGPADLLDLAVAADPMPVRLVALVRYDPDSEGWEPLGPTAAVAAILSHTICSRTRPDDAFDAVVKVVRSAAVVEGTRGDAPDAAAALLGLMDSPPG